MSSLRNPSSWKFARSPFALEDFVLAPVGPGDKYEYARTTVLLGRSGIEVWQLTDLRAETYHTGSLEATETIAGENGTPRVLLAPELALAVLGYFCRFLQNISESHMFCDIHAGTIWSFAH